MLPIIFLFTKESSQCNSFHTNIKQLIIFNADNNDTYFLSWNQHIRMTSEGLCNTCIYVEVVNLYAQSHDRNRGLEDFI